MKYTALWRTTMSAVYKILTIGSIGFMAIAGANACFAVNASGTERMSALAALGITFALLAIAAAIIARNEK